MSAAAAVVDEMSAIVRRAAEPQRPGDSVKALIRRAAVRLGLSVGRAKRYWYGELAAVWAHEADRLRQRDRELAAVRLQQMEADYARLRAAVLASGGCLARLAPPEIAPLDLSPTTAAGED